MRTVLPISLVVAGIGALAWGQSRWPDHRGDLQAGSGIQDPYTPPTGAFTVLGTMDVHAIGVASSLQLGAGANAAGPRSHAIGVGAAATGASGNDTAIGYNAAASATQTTALGQQTRCTGAGSTAVGHGAAALGTSDTVIGWGAFTDGIETVTIGTNTLADGNYNVTAGNESWARSPYAIAVGYQTLAQCHYTVAAGATAHARGSGNIALGYDAQAGSIICGAGSGADAVAFGRKTRTLDHEQCWAMGLETTCAADSTVYWGNATYPLDTVLSGELRSTATGTLGWSVVLAPNQACDTTCTAACVNGQDTDAAPYPIVNCATATADRCVCAGAT